jgi:hypothetical protein
MKMNKNGRAAGAAAALILVFRILIPHNGRQERRHDGM